ncbi:ribonuclease H-like domain-containing protein [Tanacetum coccineum]
MIIKISLHFMNLFVVLLHLLLCHSSKASIGRKDVSGVISKCIDKELQVILHFKVNLKDPFDHLVTWIYKDDNCCKWSRVTCNNQTGHVTSLDLSNIDGEGEFRGEISPSLLNLSLMNHLDLSHNSFYGAIPMFIGSLTKLAYLDLSYNHLNGTIPISIGSLTKLTYLDLHVNSFRRKSYYQIMRADGKSQMYMFFSQMLKSFDREDLEDLYKLVKDKYESTRPVEDLDVILWNDLKIMFEPHVEDKVWRNQQEYKVLNWKLYDSCGVHSLMMQHVHIYMLVEKKYPLAPLTLSMMLENKLKIDYESEMAYQLLKFIIK